jgi:hypothetical protein
MATAIVPTAAERYHLHLLSVVVVAVAAAILAILTGARFAYFSAEIAAEWRRPRSAFGFLTFVAGVTVLGERLDELGLAAPALILVGAGVLSWALRRALGARDRDLSGRSRLATEDHRHRDRSPRRQHDEFGTRICLRQFPHSANERRAVPGLVSDDQVASHMANVRR